MHKGFKCLDPTTGRIYISHDVVFDESYFPFAHLHPNAGALLRKEILLLPNHLRNQGDVSCTDNITNAPDHLDVSNVQDNLNVDAHNSWILAGTKDPCSSLQADSLHTPSKSGLDPDFAPPAPAPSITTPTAPVSTTPSSTRGRESIALAPATSCPVVMESVPGTPSALGSSANPGSAADVSPDVVAPSPVPSPSTALALVFDTAPPTPIAIP